jgi:PIN domain nuclease of toxin-antitoxin system
VFNNSQAELVLSVVSVWEMIIKARLGKLTVLSPIRPFLDRQLEDNQITILSVTLEHIFALESLPMHHRDPFDRLLLAQSLTERIPILSSDKQLASYAAEIIW